MTTNSKMRIAAAALFFANSAAAIEISSTGGLSAFSDAYSGARVSFEHEGWSVLASVTSADGATQEQFLLTPKQ